MADPITGLSVTVYRDTTGHWRWTAVGDQGAPLADGAANSTRPGAQHRAANTLGSLLRSKTLEPDDAVASWLAELNPTTAAEIIANAERLREIRGYPAGYDGPDDLDDLDDDLDG